MRYQVPVLRGNISVLVAGWAGCFVRPATTTKHRKKKIYSKIGAKVIYV